MKFKIDIKGLARIQKKLNKLAVATDVVEILDVAGAVLLNRIRTRFLNQEDTQGGKWPESKAAIKRRETGRGGGTLFASGALFHSIQLARSGPFERKIFTDLDYGRKHQFGLDGMVKREFLGISVGDALAVKSILEARIKLALK